MRAAHLQCLSSCPLGLCVVWSAGRTSQHPARFQILAYLGGYCLPSHLPLRQRCGRIWDTAHLVAPVFGTIRFLSLCAHIWVGFCGSDFTFLVATAVIRRWSLVLDASLSHSFAILAAFGGTLRFWTTTAFAYIALIGACVVCVLWECAFQAAPLPPGLRLWWKIRMGRYMT